MILWPSGSGRLPDTEEVGGSIPPRITGEEDRGQKSEDSGPRPVLSSDFCPLISVLRDAACGVAVARGPVKAEVMGFNSPRAALGTDKETRGRGDKEIKLP